jgi:ATP-dependent exoDNAse (exonuclease V) alpha subunit
MVGDKDQLPSIDAGKAFGLMLERGLPAATMGEILRQQNDKLLEAVQQTIGRNLPAALELLHERVEQIRWRKDRLAAIAKAYTDTPKEKLGSTLVVTGSNADRVDLNDRIRYRLRSRGVLKGAEVRAQVLGARGFTQAQTKDAASYQVDDVVRFQRSYKRLSVEEGETWRVRSIDPQRNAILLERGDRILEWQPHLYARVEAYREERRYLAAGDRIRWTRNDRDLDRRNGETGEVLSVDESNGRAVVRVGRDVHELDLAREPHWDHAYAQTVHAAQGRTVDHVILHVDTDQGPLVGHQSFYVAVSRARHEVSIYTDSRDNLPGAIAKSLEQSSALEHGLRSKSRALGERVLDLER